MTPLVASQLALVRGIHGAILLFIVLAPVFAQTLSTLLLHVLLLLAILMHWIANHHFCVLSLIESKLRNIPYENGFINSILKPMFGFGVSNRAAYVVTLALLLISVARIVHLVRRDMKRHKRRKRRKAKKVRFAQPLTA